MLWLGCNLVIGRLDWVVEFTWAMLEAKEAEVPEIDADCNDPEVKASLHRMPRATDNKQMIQSTQN